MISRFTLTQITVDWQVYAADHRYYDVLFIGTGIVILVIFIKYLE